MNVSSPLLAGLDLGGRLINADRTRKRHALIIATTDQSISVPGDITSATGAYGYVQNGDSFEILDLHPRGDSPRVNAGNFAAPKLLERDLEGSPRDGIEDYEYLVLLERLLRETVARAIEGLTRH